MLFTAQWTVKVEDKVKVWNAFGNMSPEDHRATEGPDLKLVGRWHKPDGSGGICVVESDSIEAVVKLCLNWAHVSNITVSPCLEDEAMAKCYQGTSVFEKMG